MNIFFVRKPIEYESISKLAIAEHVCSFSDFELKLLYKNYFPQIIREAKGFKNTRITLIIVMKLLNYL